LGGGGRAGAGAGAGDGVGRLAELRRLNAELDAQAQASQAAASQALSGLREQHDALEDNLRVFLNPGAPGPAEAVREVAEGAPSSVTAAKKDKEQWVAPGRKHAPPAAAKVEKAGRAPAPTATEKFTGKAPGASAPSPATGAAAPRTKPSAAKAPGGGASGGSTGTSTVPGDAALRLKFFEGRVKQLEKEARVSEVEAASLQAQRQELTVELEQLRAESLAWQKERVALKSTAERYRKEAEESAMRLTGERKALSDANRTNSKSSREKANVESELKAREIRLARALEEVGRYKQLVEEMKIVERERKSANHDDYTRVLAEKAQLEKQKNELMAVFRKQLRLIDVLKRQKIHLEAAQSLNLTEREFMKAVDFNGAD